MSKEVKIYGKKATRPAIVDDNSYDIVNRYRWNIDSDGYAISVGQRYKMHRLIIGARVGEIVDHINGDRLDNRLDNLRIVTASQNSFNSRHKTGISKYRGVNRSNSKIEKWEACISHNNRQLYLGTFNTPEEAAKAYDAKAIELRGRFARTNF